MARGENETTAFVRGVMLDFAERTGLVGERAPTRYLWTDAFAVCNFLELEHRTGDKTYREIALRLVDQVHHLLGRHRADDPREGWISGLGEEEGEQHPAIGGLRIGKALNERSPDEPLDERLEWDRDGQYFHYRPTRDRRPADCGAYAGAARSSGCRGMRRSPRRRAGAGIARAPVPSGKPGCLVDAGGLPARVP